MNASIHHILLTDIVLLSEQLFISQKLSVKQTDS